jgi:hypothetical protein
MSMQSLVPWAHLHEWVKQETADLQRLPIDIVDAPPFSNLLPLGAQIEDRLEAVSLFPDSGERKEWLTTLGLHLSRIVLDSEDETMRVRDLAQRLAETEWKTSSDVEIIPYIGGTPAGTARRADVVWLDKALYVIDRPIAKLARSVAQELGRTFRRQEIADAIKLCFERSTDFVLEYLEENFELAPERTAQSLWKKADTGAVEAAQDPSNTDPGRTNDTPMGASDVDETSEVAEEGGALEEKGEDEVPGKAWPRYTACEGPADAAKNPAHGAFRTTLRVQEGWGGSVLSRQWQRNYQSSREQFRLGTPDALSPLLSA